jgi:nucleoside-diphosphate-sugar epimerase
MTSASNITMKSETMTSVGIIGCGWLGSALAQQLKGKGTKVLATRSNTDNVEKLISQGIDAKVLLLPNEQRKLNTHPVFSSQCLVIAITPQFRQGRVDYGDNIEQLIIAANANPTVEQVILLSSTAVYNGLSGNTTESATLDLTADKVSVLNQAEQAVLNLSDSGNKVAYVLRLAGLVGADRHPGKFLLNGRMLKSPEAKVNLIHQQDVIGLIVSLFNNPISSGIFNGVSTTHVSKKEYYQAAANALDMAVPSFETIEEKPAQTIRIVNGDKVSSELNYQFVYPDLLAWLSQDRADFNSDGTS